MRRLLGVLCLCGCWCACLPLPADDAPTASPPTASTPPAGADPDAAPPSTPPRRRPGPGPDGLTRDLVLRDDDAPLPAEAVLAALERTPTIEFQQTPLRDALRQLADWGEFNLFLEEPQPATGPSPPPDPFARPVTGQFAKASLEAVLEELLLPGQLDWHLRHDCLWVAPTSSVAQYRFTRVYDASAILQRGVTSAELVRTVTQALDPRADPGRAVAGSGSVLLVRGSQNTQREVAGLLDELEDLAHEAEDQPAKQAPPQVRAPLRPRAFPIHRITAHPAASPPLIRGRRPITSSVSARVPRATIRPATLVAPPRTRPVAAPPQDEPLDPEETTAARWLTALDERDDYDLPPRPLQQQVAELIAPSQIPVVFDLPRLQSEGIAAALSRPHALRLKNARLESALGVLLEPAGLAWIIHLDRVWITTRQRAAEERELKAYDVANLLDAGHELDELAPAVGAMLPPQATPPLPANDPAPANDAAPANAPPPAGNSAPARPASLPVQGLGDVLIIRASQPEHWELAQVLAELDELAAQTSERDEAWSPPFEWRAYPVPLPAADGLAKTLPDLIPEGSWRGTARAGQPAGEIRPLPGLLLVKQTARAHARIARLLAPWAGSPAEKTEFRD